MARSLGRWRVVAGLLVVALAAPAPAAAQQASNPIAAENALPGDTGWRLRRRAAPGELEGYASATSVNHGEAIDLHVRASQAGTVSWALYRMGWYGGAEGRRVLSGGPVPVGPRPVPQPTATGLVECDWPATFTIATEASWASGVYLVVLTRGDGPQSYVPFVVRADERRGAAVVQASVSTWQAYNSWGGRSLYVGPAQEVSYDRPYNEGAGSGQYFRYEHAFVTWAESRGLDLVYVTNVDLDRDPALLDGQRLFLSVGHDEYWSRPARAALEAALGAGLSAAFLSANSVYWQIRLEPSLRSATPRRTQVCWKGRVAQDPLGAGPLATTRWRDPPVNEPENGLLGVMYTAWLAVDGAWSVRAPRHWLFEGTGLAEGDAIPGISGYETDRTVSNGRTPPGTEVVARSPVVDTRGRPDWHEATMRETPAGGFVFAAGTISWSWGLGHPRLADARVRRMTENLFRRAGLAPTVPEATAPLAPRPPVRDDVLRSVSTLAGAPFATGLRDGPAAEARFDRPSAAAVDQAGNVFVADTGNHAVRLVRNDAARTVVTLAGNGAAGTALGDGRSARLSRPTGIAVGPDGTVYVADTGNERLLRLRPSGERWTVERLAGADGYTGLADGDGPAARFADPAGLALADGWLYVADRQNDAIRRVDPATGRTETIALGAGVTFRFPGDVAAGGGALYVVDSGLRGVRVLSGGAVSTLAGESREGYDSGGFADGAAGDARFMPVSGIAVDGDDVLVADGGNASVRLVRGGEVSTIAGAGYGARDGGPGEARFALPTGIARLGPGEWLVVDQGASTLRRLSKTEPPSSTPGGQLVVGGGEPSGGGCGGCGSGGAGGLALLAVGALLARAVAARRRR